MNTYCARCGDVLLQPHKGKRRAWCSPRCRDRDPRRYALAVHMIHTPLPEGAPIVDRYTKTGTGER